MLDYNFINTDYQHFIIKEVAQVAGKRAFLVSRNKISIIPQIAEF